MRCGLRELRDEDLPVLFEQRANQVAAHVAAFTAPDHMDRGAFERRWSRLRADETVIARVIVVDGEVAGTIGSCGDPDEREVTYWIGRSYWGQGIATGALRAFIPLTRRVRSTHASLRLLAAAGAVTLLSDESDHRPATAYRSRAPRGDLGGRNNRVRDWWPGGRVH
jgi:RimJ/RimL family protein N-acetyltransferase